MNAVPSTVTTGNPVRRALARCRRHFVLAASFSAISNLLYLAPSLYMLQVYDRVVPTGGLATLGALSLVTAAALAALCAFEWLRSRLLTRAGARIEAELAEAVLCRSLADPSLGLIERAGLVYDFDVVRQAVASPAIVSAFDLPWTPIYILAAFLLNPLIGLLALVACAALFGLACLTDRRTGALNREASESALIARAQMDQVSHNAAEVRALGMTRALARTGAANRGGANARQVAAGFAAASMSGFTKFVRLVLQSAALGIGAVVVVKGGMSAGGMIAGSLILARALAPVEQLAGAWKTVGQARNALGRLSERLGGEATRVRTMLPDPSGDLAVEHLTVLAPGTDRIAIADIGFVIAAGQLVGLSGASGSGKSTLLRALAGAATPVRGTIRFDGMARDDYDPDHLARTVGYLPQDFVLFPGSIRDNISRFRGKLEDNAAEIDAQVIAAAKAVGAHEMIARLPQGYDTEFGMGRAGLSAGQTQRIALARAIFGDPRILLLDEPTAHLDAEAQRAFVDLLARLSVAGVTVIFSSHSADVLARADVMLTLAQGRVEQFGAIATLPAGSPPPRAMQPVSFRPGSVL